MFFWIRGVVFLDGRTKLVVVRFWGVYLEPFPCHYNNKRSITEGCAVDVVIESRRREMETKLGVVGV